MARALCAEGQSKREDTSLLYTCTNESDGAASKGGGVE